MARDTGYPQVPGGNIAVDFVWGNFPMQPDDDRTGTATQIGGGTGDYGWSQTTKVQSTALDKSLSNHSVVVNNWNGYPGFDRSAVYLDTIDQIAAPNVLGLDSTAAQAAVLGAGLVYESSLTTVTDGATVENDGTVATQTPAAGTVVNLGTTVTVSLYEYVAP